MSRSTCSVISCLSFSSAGVGAAAAAATGVAAGAASFCLVSLSISSCCFCILSCSCWSWAFMAFISRCSSSADGSSARAGRSHRATSPAPITQHAPRIVRIASLLVQGHHGCTAADWTPGEARQTAAGLGDYCAGCRRGARSARAQRDAWSRRGRGRGGDRAEQRQLERGGRRRRQHRRVGGYRTDRTTSAPDAEAVRLVMVPTQHQRQAEQRQEDQRTGGTCAALPDELHHLAAYTCVQEVSSFFYPLGARSARPLTARRSPTFDNRDDMERSARPSSGRAARASRTPCALELM